MVLPPPLPLAPTPWGPLTKLCPHCLTENEDSAHLCRSCLTPMTFFAATVPVFSIWSEMDTFRKASQAPARFIVVLAMWVLMGLMGAGFASLALDALAMTLRDKYAGGNPLACLLFLPFLAGAIICGTLLTRTTANFFGTRRAVPSSVPAPPLDAVDEELTREALAAAPEGMEPGDVEEGMTPG